MKLKNQIIKRFANDEKLRNKLTLYSNYKEPNANITRYVLTDSTDIVICNQEEVSSYQAAGFDVFGQAETDKELADLIAIAEVS